MRALALAAADLLDALRGVGLERPATDTRQSQLIRSALEAEVAPGVARLPEGVTVRATKGRLRQVLLCERHLVASSGRPATPPSPEVVAGRLMDHLFGLIVTGYTPSEDPLADAFGAAAAAGDTALDADWGQLGGEEAAEARVIVERCSASLVARWPVLPASALVRLQEPLRVDLAGGRVVLSGRVDLALGRPGPAAAGSTLVDIKCGRQRYDDRADAGWYAVLETLRHQAAPFQVGSYYLSDGALQLDVVGSELLERAAQRIGDGLRSLVGLAGGSVAATSPNPLCPWCPAIGHCEPGQRHGSERGGRAPPARAGGGECGEP